MIRDANHPAQSRNLLLHSGSEMRVGERLAEHSTADSSLAIRFGARIELLSRTNIGGDVELARVKLLPFPGLDSTQNAKQTAGSSTRLNHSRKRMIRLRSE